MPGRLSNAGLAFERGSSFERESLREEEIPDGEDTGELTAVVGVEEASDASSRESLGGCIEAALSFAYPLRGIIDPLSSSLQAS